MFSQMIIALQQTEINIMYQRLSKMEMDIAKNKAETCRDICELKYRLETSIKDQNDKLDAIMAHLGIELEKTTPKNNVYVAKKVSE